VNVVGRGAYRRVQGAVRIQGLVYTDARADERERKTGIRGLVAECDRVRRRRWIDIRPLDGLANMDLYRLRKKRNSDAL
jgi:hypothetical protein